MNTMGRAGSELVPTLLTLGETLAIAKSHGWGMRSEDIEKFHEYHLQLLTIQRDWDHLVISMEKPIAAKISVAIKWLEAASQNDVHAPPGVARMAYQSFMSTVKRAVANSGPLGALAYSVGLLDDDKQTDMAGGAAKAQKNKALSNQSSTTQTALALAESLKPRTAADMAREEKTLKGAEEKYKDAEAKLAKAQTAYFGADSKAGVSDKDGNPVSNDQLRKSWMDATSEASKYKAVVVGIKAAEEALKKSATERAAANKALLLMINAQDMQNLTGGDKYEAEQGKEIAKYKQAGVIREM